MMVFSVLLACCMGMFAGRGASYAVISATSSASTPPAKAYSGDTLLFCKDDLSTSFGMFSNPSGDLVCELRNGMVHVSFTPSNQSVFMGFYLGLGIKDVEAVGERSQSKRVTYPVEGFPEESWVGAKGKVGSFTYDFELDAGLCGYAWPIAPIELPGKDRATSREQYYLAVPPLASIPDAQVATSALDGVRQAIAALPSGSKTIASACPQSSRRD